MLRVFETLWTIKNPTQVGSKPDKHVRTSFGFSKVSSNEVLYSQAPNVCALLIIHFLQFVDYRNLRFGEGK